LSTTTVGQSQCGNWSPDGVQRGPNGVKRHRHCVRPSAAARPGRPRRADALRGRPAASPMPYATTAATLTSHSRTNSKQQFPANALASAAAVGYKGYRLPASIVVRRAHQRSTLELTICSDKNSRNTVCFFSFTFSLPCIHLPCDR